MFEDRADVAEADGGRGREKYEINSMGKPVRTRYPAEMRRKRWRKRNRSKL